MSDCSTHAFDVPLKSCPFCGGEARIFALQIGKGWRVVCSKPFCAQGPNGDTEAEAIAAWNSRAERTCHRVLDSELASKPGWHIKHRCSECGEKLNDVNYCPNCGRKVSA